MMGEKLLVSEKVSFLGWCCMQSNGRYRADGEHTREALNGKLT